MSADFDPEIIRRCQQGDIHAYKMVFDHFEQPMLRLGVSILGNQEDAEDAVQMMFLRLYRNIHRFHFQSKFSTYLYRIMVNVCLDMRRKAEREQPPKPSEASYQPSYDLRLQIQQAIAALPERMRACFVLFAVDDMTQTDIAEIMELSLGAVKAHIFQAKTRLKTLLADARSEVES